MTNSDNSDVWLTPVELAALIKVPVATVYAWSSRGSGPPSHKMGRHLRYNSQEVDVWAAEQGVPRLDLVADEGCDFDMAVYEPLAVAMSHKEGQIPLRPVFVESRRLLGMRHSEEMLAIALQLVEEAPFAQCRHCGKLTMEIADEWRHTTTSGEKSCRTASWDGSGYDPTIPKTWKAEPPEDWQDPQDFEEG